MESCEIYIKGVVYKDQSWFEEPDILLQQVFDNLNEIKNFDFASLSLNMSQVFNVSLKQSNYDSMMMYLKKVKFKHQEFLLFQDVENLVIEIKRQLDFIEDLSFVSVEVRSTKMYSDVDLGLVSAIRSRK